MTWIRVSWSCLIGVCTVWSCLIGVCTVCFPGISFMVYTCKLIINNRSYHCLLVGILGVPSFGGVTVGLMIVNNALS